MKLSNQALGAVMMALQKSIMEQTDIVPVLTGFDFVQTGDGLVVENPPVLHFPDEEKENKLADENA
tara:strand:+ start:5272 stop:5469 length:198 start_codon:yes stop_codon:yes gene_type:complete